MLDSLAAWLWIAAWSLTGPSVALDFKAIPTEHSPITLELIREEQRMGSPDPFLILEGSMSYDGTFLYCRPGSPSEGNGFRLVGPSEARLCVLRIDFTLRPLVERKEFRRVALHLALTSAGVSLHDLYPRNLAKAGDCSHSLAVSLEGTEFLALPATARQPGIFSVEDLRPVVVGLPQPGPGIAWEFRGEKEDVPLRIGSRRVFGLLSLPADRETLNGVIRFEADIGSHIFDIFRMPGTARTREERFEIRLRGPGKEQAGSKKKRP